MFGVSPMPLLGVPFSGEAAVCLGQLARMQLVDIAGNGDAARLIDPGTGADAVTGINRRRRGGAMTRWPWR